MNEDILVADQLLLSLPFTLESSPSLPFQSPNTSLASQTRFHNATVAPTDQSVFNVARKFLQAYILSENPWPTIEESKILVLKAWDSALDTIEEMGSKCRVRIGGC
jgi:hypothetical protein